MLLGLAIQLTDTMMGADKRIILWPAPFRGLERWWVVVCLPDIQAGQPLLLTDRESGFCVKLILARPELG